MATSGPSFALLLCAIAASVLANAAEIRIVRRDVGVAAAALTFPDAAAREEDGPILSEADDAGPGREQRDADGFEDYGDEEDGPEGRHLKHKLKRKFKPHKHGHGGLLGGLGGHGGGLHGGHGCRKLHGCGGGFGGGWQPPYGGYGGYGGPVAAAFAGPSQGYGGWRPPGYGGYGGYQRPTAQAQVATWNLGPFQGTFGLAQAGR